MIHSLKTTKTIGMLIKLDMSKAFNKLSWKYIKQILLTFDFSTTWIKWIMSLTSSPFFSILVNGSPSVTFSPSRNIQQGDSLSPFLFILMVDGLGRAIKVTVENNRI
jgi:hypothetical protein